MSELKINTNSSSHNFNSVEKSGAASSKPNTSASDSLKQAELTPVQSSSNSNFNTPSLPAPEEPALSFSEFLTIVADAKSSFKRMIREAELLRTDPKLQPVRRDLTQESQEILNTMSALEEADKQAAINTDQVMEKLQLALKDVRNLTAEQNEQINEILEGNTQQQQQFEKLITDYNTYVSSLIELGAVVDENGNYIIPDTPEAQAEYLLLTEEYQTSVNEFNDYASSRLEEINQYNSAAEKYNTQAAAINQKLITQLSPYVQNVPQMQLAPTILLPSTLSPITLLEVSENQLVKITPLPEYVNEIVQNHPTLITPLEMSSFNAELIQSEVRSYFDQQLVAPLNTQLDAQLDNFSFKVYLSYQDLVGLNDTKARITTKSLRKTLIPVSHSPTNSLDLLIEGKKTVEGVSRTELTKILAADILESYLSENYPNSVAPQSLSKLALISTDQFSKSSNYALTSLIQNMGRALVNLPKDSSSSALLFTLMFSTDFIEQVKNGNFDQKVALQMGAISEVNSLAPEGKRTLSNILKVNQLLILSRLMQGNVGIGEFSETLIAKLPSSQATTIRNQVAQISEQTMTEFIKNTAQSLVDQGLSEDKAQFLTKLGADALDKGWLMTPSVAIVNSAHINLSLLIDSVTAGLISSPDQRLGLNASASIAETAIQTVLSDGIPHPPESFKKALEKELEEMGMHQFSFNAAAGAILVPAETINFASISSSEGANYFQRVIGSQFGQDASTDFKNGIETLFNDLSSLILTELANLPESIQNNLIVNAMQNSSNMQNFLFSFSNSSNTLTRSISSIENIKISKNFHA